jgi:hypothetical protein
MFMVRHCNFHHRSILIQRYTNLLCIREKNHCKKFKNLRRHVYVTNLEKFIFFCELHKPGPDADAQYTHSLLWTHVRKPYPYEHLRKTVPVHLEIDEVTIGVSQSTETSPTTESITPLNPGINLEKNVSTPAKSMTWTWVSRFHDKEPNQTEFAKKFVILMKFMTLL